MIQSNLRSSSIEKFKDVESVSLKFETSYQ